MSVPFHPWKHIVDKRLSMQKNHIVWISPFIMNAMPIFVSRMDGVTRISDCTVRIQKDSYDEVYRYLRFVIKISNAFAA